MVSQAPVDAQASRPSAKTIDAPLQHPSTDNSDAQATPPSKSKPSKITQDIKADIDSLWQLLSDVADLVLGVKDHPERLLRITNAVIVGLIFSVIFLYAKLPPRIEATNQPVDWASVRISLWPRDVVQNAMVLARSPQIINYMLGGFVTLLLLLTFLINAVGTATIRAHQAEKNKKTL